MEMILGIVRRYAKRHLLTLLLLFTCLILSSCENSTTLGNNAGGVSRTSYIRITNEGSSEIGFNVVVNGKPFYTKMDDIITEINKLPSDDTDEPFHRKLWRYFTKEPFHRKLWRYLIKNRYHFDPYTGDVWGHSPVHFLNSFGFGFCDDAAAIFYALATRAGYKARVWDLNGPNFKMGHTVAEVLVNDHWEMYDPDMEVYYWNKTGQVAGVEALSDYRELITSPIHPFPMAHFSARVITSDLPPIPLAYTQLVADIYSSHIRRIEPYYHLKIDDFNFDHPFSLPPKAYLEFPVKVDHKVKSVNGTDVPSYNLMRLVLPKGWSGSVKLPFAFLAINGSGNIALNDVVYNLDSPDIANQLVITNKYIYQASVNDSLTDIQIVFLVNKKRFDLDNISSFEIKSNDSNRLTVVYR